VNPGYWSLFGAKTAFPLCENITCSSMYGICPVGSYCLTGSSYPQKCPAGTYQDLVGQSSCKVLCYFFFNFYIFYNFKYLLGML
jgi:hypothetical protein